MVVINSENEKEYEVETDVYVRVSSEDQQERETIENQIEFATKYCDLHRLRINEWYKDDGVSGTIPLEQRDEGKRLIENAKAGKIKMVLIFNMKRLGRKARVTLDAVYLLEQYGVKVKSMTEPFDTSDPVGRFIITVLAGQAELDRDTMLETMWHGANRAARKGKWLGGVVPFGYRKNEEGFIEVNEDPIPGKEDLSEVGVVQLMYDLIADQRWSTIKTADYFNSLTIPPSYVRDGKKVKKGKRKENTAGIWTPGRIGNMIKNTTYKGVHFYGRRTKRDRELIEREVPTIVSEEKWDRAQQVLRDNMIESFKGESRGYILRSLIKCGTCGLTYHGTTYSGPGGIMKPYYICGGKQIYRGPLGGKCRSRNVPAEWIENKVWDECLDFIQNPGELIKELSGNMHERKSFKLSLANELQIVKKSISEKDVERQEIISLFRKKIITAADVEKQLQDMMAERSALEKRQRDIEGQLNDEDGMTQQFDTAEIMLSEIRERINDNPSLDLKREIVKALVNQIIVVSETTDQEHNENVPRISKEPVNVEVTYSFFPPRRL
jgi:site-specific DNA recombinase